MVYSRGDRNVDRARGRDFCHWRLGTSDSVTLRLRDTRVHVMHTQKDGRREEDIVELRASCKTEYSKLEALSLCQRRLQYR